MVGLEGSAVGVPREAVDLYRQTRGGPPGIELMPEHLRVDLGHREPGPADQLDVVDLGVRAG